MWKTAFPMVSRKSVYKYCFKDMYTSLGFNNQIEVQKLKIKIENLLIKH